MRSPAGSQQRKHLTPSSLSPLPQSPRPSTSSLLDIQTELQQYAASLESPEQTALRAAEPRPRLVQSFRLFRPDAFTAPGPTLYALKLTLAATLCYTVYNAIAWPGILTCGVTVLFTGLSPTGQMKQRQLYRFFGTAVGGILAIAAESFFFPNMDSITSLLLVAGAIAFLSAWVIRSPHIGTAGTQIGFAFFLTTLQGFGATTQIATARDRVFGVVLGVLIMWFIFDQIWPTRTSQALGQILRRIRAATLQLQQVERQRDPQAFAQTLARLRVTVSQDLASVQLLQSGAYFDFGPDQVRELAQTRRMIRQIETAAAAFYTEALQRQTDNVAQNELARIAPEKHVISTAAKQSTKPHSLTVPARKPDPIRNPSQKALASHHRVRGQCLASYLLPRPSATATRYREPPVRTIQQLQREHQLLHRRLLGPRKLLNMAAVVVGRDPFKLDRLLRGDRQRHIHLAHLQEVQQDILQHRAHRQHLRRNLTRLQAHAPEREIGHRQADRLPIGKLRRTHRRRDHLGAIVLATLQVLEVGGKRRPEGGRPVKHRLRRRRRRKAHGHPIERRAEVDVPGRENRLRLGTIAADVEEKVTGLLIDLEQHSQNIRMLGKRHRNEALFLLDGLQKPQNLIGLRYEIRVRFFEQVC